MKIYFAHPAFTDAQMEFKARFLDSLRLAVEKKYLEKGAPVPEIADPFQYAPNIEATEGHKMRFSTAIASVCCRLMQDCFLVIAVADYEDTGVAFELGFAYALDIPSLLVSETKAADKSNAMLRGTSRACIPEVLQADRISILVDLIYGFWATQAQP